MELCQGVENLEAVHAPEIAGTHHRKVQKVRRGQKETEEAQASFLVVDQEGRLVERHSEARPVAPRHQGDSFPGVSAGDRQ